MKREKVIKETTQLSQDAKIAVFSLIAFLLVTLLFILRTQFQQQAQAQQPQQIQNGSY